MDLEKIQAYRDQQTLVREEQAKQMDSAYALSEILKSQRSVESTIRQTLQGVVKFLNAYTPEVSVNNQKPYPTMDGVVSAVKDVIKEVQNSNKTLTTVSKKDVDLSKVVASLDALTKAVNKLPSSYPTPPEAVTVKNQPDYGSNFDSLLGAIEKIDVRPEVNVAAPTVDVAPLDVSPLVALFEQDQAVDLSDFKVQDLTGDDSFQYVGFVSPSGSWYILENDISGGTFRYKFGAKDYAKNWKNPNSHSFKLLNEAIREIKT